MVANLNWIDTCLATGGDLSYNDDVAFAQVEDIVAQGIELVIDLREEAEDSDIWAEYGINYLHVGTNDAYGHHVPTAIFDAIVAEALPVYKRGGKVLVHCHMGVNRGPSGAYAVMLALGIEPVKAYKRIREVRPQVALAYAMDALDAHHLRAIRTNLKADLPADNLRVTYRQERDRLERHINKVWTPEATRRVNHIIRDNHRKDALDRRVNADTVLSD